jgi:hypothetical protein
MCVSNAIAKRGATNCQEWVQKVTARYIDVQINTLIKEIQIML